MDRLAGDLNGRLLFCDAGLKGTVQCTVFSTYGI